MAEGGNGYCLSLLDVTGICMVPVSGFVQQLGTLHFGTTFLSAKEETVELLARLGTFRVRTTEAMRWSGAA